MNKKKLNPYWITLACVLGLALGLGLATPGVLLPQDAYAPKYVYAPSPEPEEEEPEPEPEPIYHPLTHLATDQEPGGRTYLVSIDNNPDARPHSGISQAKIIYEVPAEGGIPRMIALFHGDSVEKIGPVRSARPYMVDIARSWGGVFTHCGWSEEARMYLQQGVVDYVNELSLSRYFWRSDDRYAPHNLYTSTERLAEWADDYEKNYDQALDWMDFRTDGDMLQGQAIDRIQVKYAYANNIYRYNPSTGCYDRFIGDEPFIDKENNQQLHPANIIVMRVVSRTTDSYGRLAIDLTAGGQMWFFSAGVMTEGVWSHPTKDEMIRFYDSDGQEIRLFPGQTFVELIDGGVDFNYENTAAPEQASPDGEDDK